MTLNLHFADEHYIIPYCFEVEQYGFYYTVAQIIIKTMTGCIDGLLLLSSNVICFLFLLVPCKFFGAIFEC